MQTYGMEYVSSDEAPAPKLSSSRKFLIAIKEIAHDIGCYTPLQAIENGLNSISKSYSYNNTFASVGFNASVLAPELRSQSEIISARLSMEDLEKLRYHFVRIQDHIAEIADNQRLGAFTPLLLSVSNTTENVLLSAAINVYSAFGARDTAHDLKQEMLTEMLYSFERAGRLASLIKVNRLQRSDYYKMEEISSSLDTIKPIFKKAKVL